ncbi:hypothetical protein MSG28_016002 [Choristoneura fumiferana]|uniref:Uncharacterized protein n=1 Tax=Choristoneura fumiferana TaxID=7141 RepID=A0ACC0K5H1_CHOFU|nr:hypothetical protein MSG28_016002 [Choristoneura fumiferana]
MSRLSGCKGVLDEPVNSYCIFRYRTTQNNIHCTIEQRDFKVCYICEAMAARTVRFQEVVTLAASVEAMITWMTDELRDAMVRSQLFPDMYISPEMRRTICRMREVEAALQNTTLPQFACSHVLVVGTDTQPPGDDSRLTSPVGTSETRPSGTRFNKEPILVKDDPPSTGGLVQASSVPGQLQLQVKEQATGHVALHPIILGSNQKMYVPSLKVEIINNELLKHVTDLELFEYANIPMPPPPPPPPPLTPVPKETKQTKHENGTMISNYFDFIQKISEHKEKFENKDQKEQDVDATILNKKARLESQNIDGVSDTVSVGDVMKPVRTYAMKKPVLQMHKVLDWEDKIPMDVISFMDATDPNPNERIMQPNKPISPPTPCMGVISDVRTIKESESNGFNINDDIFSSNVNEDIFNSNDSEDVDNDVVLVENIECIDLC